jgi:anti-anti-sigma factor
MEPADRPVVPGLTLSVRTVGSSAVAELTGELDITWSPGLREQLLGLLRRRSNRLVLDLSAVTYCDASGLAVLVGTGRRATLLGGSLRLAALSPQVHHGLQVTGLLRHLDVYATVQAAITSPDSTRSGILNAVTRDRGAIALPRALGGRAWRSQGSTNCGELRDVAVALLAHGDAWRDADPSRRFSPALQAIARACRGDDDTALESAARSLMAALARHPLAHSQAVATSATRLRHVLDAGLRPTVA